MITLFTGRPGSGKSYRVVSELKKLSQKYLIFHNIRGLQHDKFEGAELRQIDDFLKSQEIEIQQFLDLEYQENLCKLIKEKYDLRVLVVLDECYQFVGTDSDPRLKRSIQKWLAQHRHLGQDVFLICQNPDQLYRPIKGLLFERVHAKKGKLLHFFLYDHYEGHQKIGTSKLPARQEIFSLYSSFQIASRKIKTSKKLYYLIAALVLSVAVCSYGFWSLTGGRVAKAKQLEKQIEEKKPDPEKKIAQVQVEEKAEVKKNTPVLPEFSVPDEYRLIAFSDSWVFFADSSGRIERIADGIVKIENGQVLIPYNRSILRLPFRFSRQSDCYFDFDNLPAAQVFKLFCIIKGFDFSLDTLADFKITVRRTLRKSDVSDFFESLFREKGFVPFSDRGLWRCAGDPSAPASDIPSPSVSGFFTDSDQKIASHSDSQ